MNNVLNEFRKEFHVAVPAQVDHATVDGNVITVPESVAHLGPELSQAALDQQAVFDARALQRALEPVLATERWRVVGVVSGTQKAVQVAPTPRTVDYADVPVGALALLASAQESPGAIRITAWKYTTNEEARTVTIYPKSDKDTGLPRAVNDLTAHFWEVIELYENRADASTRYPVTLKAPIGTRVKTREGWEWNTELTEGEVLNHFIELDESLRNEEEN